MHGYVNIKYLNIPFPSVKKNTHILKLVFLCRGTSVLIGPRWKEKILYFTEDFEVFNQCQLSQHLLSDSNEFVPCQAFGPISKVSLNICDDVSLSYQWPP